MRKRLAQFLSAYLRDRRGNVAMIFALALIPTVYLAGMGVDYGLAAQRQTQLNAFADAAVLAAVTPAMMVQSNSAAIAAATNTFNAQANAMPGITYSPSGLSVTVTNNGALRTVKVTYTATSTNTFPSVLGQSTIQLSGTASATGGMQPNIDFYVLADDSPSMAIAATQAGINTMVAATPSQGGCAFACHETHPSTDNLGNPGGEDNYTLARNLGVTLRIDLVAQAIQNLTATATSTMAKYNSSYRMGVYTFDYQLNTVATLNSNLSSVQSAASGIGALITYANGYLTKSNNNNDTDTSFDAGFNGINKVMPNPGSGTTNAGDTPQEVLFVVTDGVEDENVSGSRVQSVMNTALCTTIKNRGIRIAVLYTEYLPLPTNGWYNSYIAPFQSNIGPTLQACASPGLYYEVQTGGDISAALTSLFQAAVQSAYLSQ